MFRVVYCRMPVLCSECVTDSVLRAWVEEHGEEATCTFCGEEGLCAGLEALSNEIDVAIRRYYGLATQEAHVSPEHDNLEYYAEGETAEDIISEFVCSSDAVAAIVGLLSALEQRDVRDGGDALYDRDSLLEHAGASAGEYLELWEAFEHRVKHEVRFFDERARQMLDELFGDLPQLAEGRAVVTLTPSASELRIYRARLISNEAETEDFIRDPARHIGPPPSSAARGGRMNAEGIPAFYGAFSSEVALAEIRPPVGSLVAIGEFSVLREVKLLDMSFLPFAYHDESIFSPEYDQARSKVTFLRVFHRRISRPVLPSDEALAYISTQAVAAYVENVLGLDGIIYSSTQVGAEDESIGEQLPRTLCNLVLFGDAAVVERTPAPPRPRDYEFGADPLVPTLGWPEPGLVAPTAPTQSLTPADAVTASGAQLVGVAAAASRIEIAEPSGLGEDGRPATLRIARDPRLARVRAVKVETAPIVAHLYEDGRVLLHDFEDYEE
jgi:hypothetical protein